MELGISPWFNEIKVYISNSTCIGGVSTPYKGRPIRPLIFENVYGPNPESKVTIVPERRTDKVSSILDGPDFTRKSIYGVM